MIRRNPAFTKSLRIGGGTLAIRYPLGVSCFEIYGKQY
jgi:hypothetical protein